MEQEERGGGGCGEAGRSGPLGQAPSPAIAPTPALGIPEVAPKTFPVQKTGFDLRKNFLEKLSPPTSVQMRSHEGLANEQRPSVTHQRLPHSQTWGLTECNLKKGTIPSAGPLAAWRFLFARD